MAQVTKINTGICRASYLTVITPRAQNGGDEKYSVQLLIPKTDTATINAVKGAIAAAIAEDRKGKNRLVGIEQPKTTLHDGDGLRPSGGKYGEECFGHMVLSTSSKQKPGLVDINNNLLPEAAEWYSGIYVRANINFYAYNTGGSKGIACGLNHLKKMRDGEALSGGGDPSSAFDDDYQEESSVLG